MDCYREQVLWRGMEERQIGEEACASEHNLESGEAEALEWADTGAWRWGSWRAQGG